MRQVILTSTLLTLAGLMFATGGCAEPLKADDGHLGMLEDQNRDLNQRLATAKQAHDALLAEREALHAQLASARQEMDALRTAAHHRPQPTPAPPPPADGWEAVPGGAMIAIEGSVLFDSGKAVLRGPGRELLEKVSRTIQGTYASKDIFVFGHTDDAPIKKSGWKDNYELSTQRALTVVRFLADKGIEERRLVACGAGEHRPRVPNSGRDSRAKNRRVEIFAIDPVH